MAHARAACSSCSRVVAESASVARRARRTSRRFACLYREFRFLLLSRGAEKMMRRAYRMMPSSDREVFAKIHSRLQCPTPRLRPQHAMRQRYRAAGRRRRSATIIQWKRGGGGVSLQQRDCCIAESASAAPSPRTPACWRLLNGVSTVRASLFRYRH